MTYNNITCSSTNYISFGMPSYRYEDIIPYNAIPYIKNKKVYISFNVEDCKDNYLDVMNKNMLDQAVNFTGISNKFKYKTTKEKSHFVKINYRDAFSQFLTNISKEDIKYYNKLIKYLNCLTALDFEIVSNFDLLDSSDFKVAICSTKDYYLQKAENRISNSAFSIGDDPTKCLALFDQIEITNSISLQVKQNILGSLMLNCLGLGVVNYPSIYLNQDHRSMLENDSPILKECMRLKIMDPTCFGPVMPTSEDICALSTLYGSSINTPQSCDKIVSDFITKYPDINIEKVSISSTGESCEYPFC